MKQFIEKNGYTVHKVQTPFAVLPVTVLTGNKIVVLGDYSLSSNCLGVDRFGNLKSNIMDCIVEAEGLYKPEAIIYEYKLGSHLYKSTKEIIELGKAYGYQYIGVFLKLSERERYERIITRSGIKARTAKFKGEQEQCKRSCIKLEQDGHKIVTVDAERINKEDMWKVVDYAVRKANG